MKLLQLNVKPIRETTKKWQETYETLRKYLLPQNIHINHNLKEWLVFKH